MSSTIRIKRRLNRFVSTETFCQTVSRVGWPLFGECMQDVGGVSFHEYYFRKAETSRWYPILWVQVLGLDDIFDSGVRMMSVRVGIDIKLAVHAQAQVWMMLMPRFIQVLMFYSSIKPVSLMLLWPVFSILPDTSVNRRHPLQAIFPDSILCPNNAHNPRVLENDQFDNRNGFAAQSKAEVLLARLVEFLFYLLEN